MRINKREQFIVLGKEILEKLFKSEDQSFSEKELVNVISNFEAETIDDIYAKVGEGLITGWDVLRAMHPAYKQQNKLEKMVNSIKLPVFKKETKKDALKIKGLIDGMAVHFAGCCHPLPGDRIVGIVTTGKGVTVHTVDCPSLKNYESEPERWLDIDWGDNAEHEKHVARLKLMLSNEPGALADVANIVAKAEANIMNLNITYRTVSYYEILLDIEVKNVEQLNTLILSLKSSKLISYVARATR